MLRFVESVIFIDIVLVFLLSGSARVVKDEWSVVSRCCGSTAVENRMLQPRNGGRPLNANNAAWCMLTPENDEASFPLPLPFF